MPNEEPGATPNQTPPSATLANPNPAAPAPGVTPDTAAKIADLETKLANADARIKELNRENRDYRLLSDAIKSIGATPEELKGKIESLNGEVAKWRELGEKPEVVKASLDTGAAAIAERDNLTREKLQNEAGALKKLKPSAFSAKWLGDAALVIEGEGEARDVFVQQGDKKTAWGDFVSANSELADVIPALQIAPNAPQGTPFVRVPNGQPDKARTDHEAASRAQSGITKRAFG